jgi:hypothetical protein
MKTWMAVLIGFLLGAFLQSLPNLRAQSSTREIGIHVRKFRENASDGMVPGSQVVRFSCLESGCFVATKD